MALHIRLLRLEFYLPEVSDSSELVRALGPLKRFCKNQSNIALSIDPFSTVDRGVFSVIVIGANRKNVEQESEHLMAWIESHIEGQSLASSSEWL